MRTACRGVRTAVRLRRSSAVAAASGLPTLPPVAKAGLQPTAEAAGLPASTLAPPLVLDTPFDTPTGQLNAPPCSTTLGAPPFALASLDLFVGDRSLRCVAPADEGAVLDAYIDAGELDADPYWATAWPSSLALAADLFARPRAVAGLHVLDLGCGLGLAGAAAALCGARLTVLADLSPWALHCALRTAEANGLAPTWPAAQQQQQPPPGAQGTVLAAVLDWRSPPPPALRGAFDVLLAADVLYGAGAAPAVASFALALLRPGGRLLLADPPDRTPAHRAAALAALAAAGALGGGQPPRAVAVPPQRAGGPAAAVLLHELTAPG